jgi:hypothetical protein
MTAERRAAIPGFEDIYEVSDRGEVRSLERIVNAGGAGRGQITRRAPERILKPSRGIRGRLRVNLFRWPTLGRWAILGWGRSLWRSIVLCRYSYGLAQRRCRQAPSACRQACGPLNAPLDAIETVITLPSRWTLPSLNPLPFSNPRTTSTSLLAHAFH